MQEYWLLAHYKSERVWIADNIISRLLHFSTKDTPSTATHLRKAVRNVLATNLTSLFTIYRKQSNWQIKVYP